MAQIAAIRTAMTRIGFEVEAANLLTDDQGMNALEELALLTDEEVTNLCRVIRRPGGTIVNPNAAAGQPANIPNPGRTVSLRAENNLKLTCYFLRYKQRTSRALLAADITLDAVRGIKSYKEWEENHKDVEPPEIDAKDWPRTIDSLEEYLRGCLGVTKIPLAYVIRATIAVTAEATDPQANYVSKQDELIARAPITVAGHDIATYLSDRARVWELISNLTRDQDCWSYVRPAQRARDSRTAFLGLRGHFLGANVKLLNMLLM
jgi:hypothetical protein